MICLSILTTLLFIAALTNIALAGIISRMRRFGVLRRSAHFIILGLGLSLLIPGLFGANGLGKANWNVGYVYREKMSEEDFLRISEFFTGKENMGFHLVLRTNSEEREGLYFIIGLNGNVNDLPKGTELRINYILSDNPDPQTISFDLPEGQGMSRELYVGLTGESMPLDGEPPLAWEIEFLDAEKEILIKNQSFLWKMPQADTAG